MPVTRQSREQLLQSRQSYCVWCMSRPIVKLHTTGKTDFDHDATDHGRRHAFAVTIPLDCQVARPFWQPVRSHLQVSQMALCTGRAGFLSQGACQKSNTSITRSARGWAVHSFDHDNRSWSKPSPHALCKDYPSVPSISLLAPFFVRSGVFLSLYIPFV